MMQELRLFGYCMAGFGLFKAFHELLRISPMFAGLAVTSQIVAVGGIFIVLGLAHLFPNQLVNHFKIDPNILILGAFLTLAAMLLGVACAWIG